MFEKSIFHLPVQVFVPGVIDKIFSTTDISTGHHQDAPTSKTQIIVHFAVAGD